MLVAWQRSVSLRRFFSSKMRTNSCTRRSEQRNDAQGPQRHEVIASEGQLVSLNTKSLTLVQKAHIRMICEQKLQSFVQKRGIGICDYRLLDEEPISDNLAL